MARILIVDDQPLNRELLVAYLESAQHEIIEAEDGLQALASCQPTLPDLVLLDVSMPGMDGFVVTRRLKELAGSAYLPVILVTALADQQSRIAGLKSGADEFLTKPVDRTELTVRVAALLALQSQTRALLKRNVELAELQRFREEMTGLLVHDLKGPLAAVMANLDYLIGEIATDDIDVNDALAGSREASLRLLRLLANLLDTTRAEEGRLKAQRTALPLKPLLGSLLAQRGNLARLRTVTLALEVDGALAAFGDDDLVTRVVENILDNAIRYTPSGGRVEIAAACDGAFARISIGNSGRPIPPEAHQRIFEKYGQATAGVGRMNLGLGLYFCRLAIETMGGQLHVESRPALPTVFVFELPLAA